MSLMESTTASYSWSACFLTSALSRKLVFEGSDSVRIFRSPVKVSIIFCFFSLDFSANYQEDVYQQAERVHVPREVGRRLSGIITRM